MRIAVLNNLRAGRSGVEVRRILSLLREYPEVRHVETGSAQALPDAIASLGRHGVDLLVVNGGDGTLQYTLTEILEGEPFDSVPWVAPLRGGRTNMTALDLGAHRNPVTGLRNLLDDARAGRLEARLVDRPVLRVDSSRRREVQYGMFFGVGMIHRAIALTHKVFPPGRSQGVLGSGVVTGSLIWKATFRPREGVLTPDKVGILLDGEMVPHGEFYLVIATALRRLFLRMNPFWGDGPGGVRLTAIASRARKTRRAALGLLRGRPPRFATPEAGYTSRNAARAELGLDCGYTVDGEIFPPQPDEVVTLTADRRVRFLRA